MANFSCPESKTSATVKGAAYMLSPGARMRFQPGAGGGPAEPVRLATRTFNSPVVPADPSGLVPLAPLGIGKPLAIELAFVSAGDGVRLSSDLLITSSIKKLPVYDASPRAVNAIARGVRDRFSGRVDAISPTLPWTPLVYYSKAHAERSVTVGIECVFDKYNDDIVQQIAGLVGAAAGIPIFMPASAFLMAGSMLAKIGSRILEKIIDGRPAFSDTITINLDRPGSASTPAAFHVLYQNSLTIDAGLRSGTIVFDSVRGLVDAQTKEPIDTRDPYIVLLVYGNEMPDYESFVPTMATAAMLDRFFHTGETGAPITGDILNLLKATNDIRFRNDAKRLIGDAQLVDASTEDGKKKVKLLKDRFDAAVKNLTDASLAPAWPLG